MKKLCLLIIPMLLAAACSPVQQVNARYVPERMDDFVFENDLYCFRVYGKALEGNPTSPGFDFWAKNCDTLVAEGRYLLYAQGSDVAYHHDRGNGKDCYKVAVSLGAGASSPLIADTLRYPATNYRSYDMLESKPGKAVFVLHYPEWEACGYRISLDKKFTVTAGRRFCEVEDTYTFSGPTEELDIAAGIFRHREEDLLEEYAGPDRVAVWEHASDQSVEPEDGLIGVAVVMPGADRTAVMCGHSLCVRKVRSGEPLRYRFSAVWSKYDVHSAADWFSLVNKQ